MLPNDKTLLADKEDIKFKTLRNVTYHRSESFMVESHIAIENVIAGWKQGHCQILRQTGTAEHTKRNAYIMSSVEEVFMVHPPKNA